MVNPEVPPRYVHGYEPGEQERLIAQAEYWRDLILDGTKLADGTRLLDVGCGVGAVLGILGAEFPGVRLTGVDVETKQVAAAREHLGRHGLPADLRVADGRRLPFPDDSFDHVWMMWFLEHLTPEDAVAALGEARRVLAPGGTITAIEGDYGTVRFAPANPSIEALWSAVRQAMRTFGQEDAGPRLRGWLEEAGFTDVDPGERLFSFHGAEVTRNAHWMTDGAQATITDIAALPDTPDEATLQRGLDELRALGDSPEAELSYVVNKASAVA
jgi:ubiquinone/menaquinone biosynthesis C-methylase UbiE